VPPVCSVSARLPSQPETRSPSHWQSRCQPEPARPHGLRLSRDPGLAGPEARAAAASRALRAQSVTVARCGRPARPPAGPGPPRSRRLAVTGVPDRRAQALARCGRQGAGGARTPPPRTPPPTPDLPLPGQARAGIGPADSEFKHWLGT
jgi:hypothetical protein